MTKSVRVENADTSDHKVMVHTEELRDGVWVRLPGPQALNHPTALTTLTIWKERRLVIEEA